MAGDDFELDVHAQRRRVLWQRTFLQALHDLMVEPPVDSAGRPYIRSDGESARRAAELARDAVERFDAWENSQARPAGVPAPGGGGGVPDREDDDPDNLYLGR
jgi:hypothetical protein